jgi:hypothetical protein
MREGPLLLFPVRAGMYAKRVEKYIFSRVRKLLSSQNNLLLGKLCLNGRLAVTLYPR